MKIKNYISKDLVIGAIGGSILATIITSIIDTKAVNKSNEELKLSNEKLEEVLERLKEGDEVLLTATHQLKVSKEEREKLEKELEKYKTKEVLEERERIKKEEAKKAIEEKQWDDVYRLTERWYNHYPVQMSRSEVFTNLEKDGYITQEERTEAYNYFGSLWNYVGD